MSWELMRDLKISSMNLANLVFSVEGTFLYLLLGLGDELNPRLKELPDRIFPILTAPLCDFLSESIQLDCDCAKSGLLTTEFCYCW